MLVGLLARPRLLRCAAVDYGICFHVDLFAMISIQVKEDVAWLLEDASDGGWKPVRDDGRVKVITAAVDCCCCNTHTQVYWLMIPGI